MSLWQGRSWTHRSNLSGSASGGHVPRTSISGNSSAAASNVSLVSSSSGNLPPPRRPLNALGLRQERRSISIPPVVKQVETTVKSDHDPLKTLTGILGEVPSSEGQASEDGNAVEEATKVDAGGKTLAAWLEELEKDKLDRLQKVIDQRTSSSAS